MIRAPPRFPLPFAAHRNFRVPPAPGITSPASGWSIRYTATASIPSAPINSVASALNFGNCRTVISGASSTTQEYTALRYKSWDAELGPPKTLFGAVRKPDAVTVIGSRRRMGHNAHTSSWPREDLRARRYDDVDLLFAWQVCSFPSLRYCGFPKRVLDLDRRAVHARAQPHLAASGLSFCPPSSVSCEHLMERYFTELANAFVRGRLGDRATMQDGIVAGLRLHKFKVNAELPRVQRVLGILRGLSPDRLLDVGSGRGTFLWPLLAAFPQVPVTAIDSSERRAGDLAAVSRGGVERLTVVRMDAEMLGFVAKSFDVV